MISIAPRQFMQTPIAHASRPDRPQNRAGAVQPGPRDRRKVEARHEVDAESDRRHENESEESQDEPTNHRFRLFGGSSQRRPTTVAWRAACYANAAGWRDRYLAAIALFVVANRFVEGY